MPFIPHTETDIRAMLDAIGIRELSDLFSEIPHDLPVADLSAVPDGLNERETTRLLQERAPSSKPGGLFIGAGAYEHHIPAAVWDIVSRGEFYTAYTPYQAEASQGTLQLIYEYQTMMCELMGLPVSNASLYDGASALAEAVLMAIRIQSDKPRVIFMPETVHPHYREVVSTIVRHQGIELRLLTFNKATGLTHLSSLREGEADEAIQCDAAALIIPQPNFFGCLEEVDALTDWAHAHGLLVIAVVNPMAMALLKEPGQWGKNGADIACGEGQPLGVPLSLGGPYFGFMCTKKEFVRQLPGRIVGKSVDAQGRTGFTLTLQAREQHIRRSKATSNICTNQGLLVTAATIYMSLMGFSGLKNVAALSHAQAKKLGDRLSKKVGVKMLFSSPFFHEFVIQVPNAEKTLEILQSQGIQGGLLLEPYYPALKNTILICVTETKTDADLEAYLHAIRE